MDFIDAGGVEYIIINLTECKIKSVNNGLPYTNIIIPNIAYDGSTPYNVITIDGNLFDFISPSIIVTVTIPTSITTIEDYAFTNLINLENVYFDSPSNIQYINDHAFLFCPKLESIIIPASIIIIDFEAFAICTSLTTVTFLDLTNVITSGGFAPDIFAGSTNLNTIYYNGSVQDYNYLNNYFTTNYPSLNVKIISFQPPFTSCSHTPPDPPNLWSRATLSCVKYDVYSQEEFAMRQKAEVLKYKGNKNPLTKKQQFSRNVNGNGPLGKKVWATQNDLGSNPNVFNLPQVGNTLILCPNDDTNNIKCEPSSASDVPGNSVLCYDPAVPLANYLPPQRTYLAGGTKWPQSTWKPGDNGFPRGKKGMGMLFQ